MLVLFHLLIHMRCLRPFLLLQRNKFPNKRKSLQNEWRNSWTLVSMWCEPVCGMHTKLKFFRFHLFFSNRSSSPLHDSIFLALLLSNSHKMSQYVNCSVSVYCSFRKKYNVFRRLRLCGRHHAIAKIILLHKYWRKNAKRQTAGTSSNLTLSRSKLFTCERINTGEPQLFVSDLRQKKIIKMSPSEHVHTRALHKVMHTMHNIARCADHIRRNHILAGTKISKKKKIWFFAATHVIFSYFLVLQLHIQN